MNCSMPPNQSYRLSYGQFDLEANFETLEKAEITIKFCLS